ncbi:MAG: hypothetical protein ABIA63_08910 [bacterium]
MNLKKIKIPTFKITAILFGIIFTFLAVELAIRIAFPYYMWKYRDSSDDWELNNRLGWTQKPHLNAISRIDNGTVIHFQTNMDGLTPPGAKRENEKNRFRIMIFGNSTVVGRNVPQNQTLNSHLETILTNRKINAEVINAGVQGYSTDQVLLRMQELLPLYKPDLVAYGFCINDMPGNSTSRIYGTLLKPRFVIGNNGKLKLLEFDIKKSRIRKFGGRFQKFLGLSAVYRYFQPKIFLLRSKFMNWDEKNLLGLAMEYYYNPEKLNDFNWALFGRLLKQMNAAAKSHNAGFFFYTHPDIAAVWEPFIKRTLKIRNINPAQYNPYALEDKLMEIGKENGVILVPVIYYFLQNKGQKPLHLLPRDPHCNGRGYSMLAQTISNKLDSLGLLVRQEVIPE